MAPPLAVRVTKISVAVRVLKGKSREIWLPIFFTELDREFNFKQHSNLFHQKIFTGNAWFFAFKVAFLGKIAWFCCCKLPWIEKFHATSHDNDEVIFHSSATKMSHSVAVPFFKQVDILFYRYLKCVLAVGWRNVVQSTRKVHRRYVFWQTLWAKNYQFLWKFSDEVYYKKSSIWT